MSKLTSLSTDVPAITASSGNHGLALATAAQMTGHVLTVVLPETVAREKLSRIKALGVQTILHSNDSGLAEQHAQKLAKEQGIIYCSPYNDPQVIAGQGTIALELLQQLPHLPSGFPCSARTLCGDLPKTLFSFFSSAFIHLLAR